MDLEELEREVWIMALTSLIVCKKCRQEKSVVHPASRQPGEVCGDCLVETGEEKKQAHLAELAALPIKERIRRIEEWIYDHNRRRHGGRPTRIG